jgi:hypothetical protein
VRRRRFDHLVNELSVEVGRAVPRFALWTAFGDAGLAPEGISRDAILAFFDGPLDRFLRAHGMAITERAERRLRRRIARYDPVYPSPEEIFARL